MLTLPAEMKAPFYLYGQNYKGEMQRWSGPWDTAAQLESALRGGVTAYPRRRFQVCGSRDTIQTEVWLDTLGQVRHVYDTPLRYTLPDVAQLADIALPPAAAAAAAPSSADAAD